MSCGAGRRHGSDLVWLWLWRRPVATAPTGPLAWEPPYAAYEALKRQIYIYTYMYIYTTSKPIRLKIQCNSNKNLAKMHVGVYACVCIIL